MSNQIFSLNTDLQKVKKVSKKVINIFLQDVKKYLYRSENSLNTSLAVVECIRRYRLYGEYFPIFSHKHRIPMFIDRSCTFCDSIFFL